MEMVALVLVGIFTVAVIQQQRRSMQRLREVRSESAQARPTGRKR